MTEKGWCAMTEFSRRSFFGGMLGMLGALFGAKANKATGTTPLLSTQPQLPQSYQFLTSLGQRTTLVYDSRDRLVSINHFPTTISYSGAPFLPGRFKDTVVYSCDVDSPFGQVELPESKAPTNNGGWRRWREGAD
jgi:hypothetical protein